MKDIKYCATAFIDLLGFSSHMENSSNDLRTTIGQEATKRLKIIEDSLEIVEDEYKNYKEFYPDKFFYQRINDGLILTIDLPDFILPNIGSPFTNSIPHEELEKIVDPNTTIEDVFAAAEKSVVELTKFIGLVARIHNYINNVEANFHFPGAKTVISTGFRKIFIDRNNNEDFLAANFSFSNAFKAEQHLHGAKFYIDCYILQLLSINKYSRNLVKSSIFINEFKPLDPFQETDDYLKLNIQYKESTAQLINLFHKQYYFREINSNRIALTQIITEYYDYMTKNPDHKNTTKFFGGIFDFITANEVKKEEAQNIQIPINDLQESIKRIYEYTLFGASKESIGNRTRYPNLLTKMR